MSCSQQGGCGRSSSQIRLPPAETPQCGMQPPEPASPGDSPRPAGRSGPGSCQITAFALGSGGCESLRAPFESKVFLDPVVNLRVDILMGAARSSGCRDSFFFLNCPFCLCNIKQTMKLSS